MFESSYALAAATQPDYGILAFIPPAVAVAVAVLSKRAILALLAAVYSGALLVSGNILTAAEQTIDTHLVKSLADPDHAAILIFSVTIGGFVGLLSATGGTRALVAAAATKIRSKTSGMLATFFSGLLVFFDDYANCLLVGSTMRPVTDSHGISREKLAYIVDSTAAPVAIIAVASTWVGFIISELTSAIPNGGGYGLFLSVLPYTFYSFFTLFFVFMIAKTGLDFGPMKTTKPVELVENETSESTWKDGALYTFASIFVLIGLLAGALLYTGYQPGASITGILGNADPYKALLWASAGASLFAFCGAIFSKRMTLGEALDGWTEGAARMFEACMILVLAWALGSICKTDLALAQTVTGALTPTPWILPTLVFLTSSLIAFATGTSYGTMGIMFPVVAAIVVGDSFVGSEAIMLGSLAAVMSGAVMGDHCSPISDTTIMASMGCGCDHVAHVKTQIPYALTTAGFTIIFGYLPIGLGLPVYICLPAGVLAIFGFFAILRINSL